ncbi:histidine phosphatase family protein [Paenibacillus sp. NPDC058071]|uniref:histidine phosphatase family protein n=1 Tax=Paenibacillus sp. NPDC058071 TaxID=3346326 RepID=UPI0036DBF147
MEITLIRHGKSLWIEDKPVTCGAFKHWVEKYDNNGVFEEKSYPAETVEKASAATVVVTSDLKRAIESAKLLNSSLPAVSDPLFRETELPAPSVKLGGLRLNPSLWAVMLRCLWFSGYARECESLKDAQIRAEKAAAFLDQCAKENQNVVLVGHGFFNRFIGKELKKRGWDGVKKPSSKHWHCTTYTFNR